MPPVLTTQSTTQSVQAMMNTTLAGMGQPPLNIQPNIPPFTQDIDLRADPRLSRQAPPQMPPINMDMDMRMMPTMQIPSAFDQRSVPPQVPPPTQQPTRARDPRDPRQKAQQSSSSQLAAQIHRGIQNDASDQEKAALIMQVLKLTDDQIAILPAEQRASILALKEQIAKSANLK